MRKRTMIFFFFNDTATTEIYTLSLHDALPISEFGEVWVHRKGATRAFPAGHPALEGTMWEGDRKSTRLNSSHLVISYAVFCLKKKKTCNVGVPDVILSVYLRDTTLSDRRRARP